MDHFEDQRRMHALTMKLCSKLWEVGNVEAFQNVFVDFIECECLLVFFSLLSTTFYSGHYRAYADARVLHRGLSENNLMFMLGEAGVVKGILSDWDLAPHADADNEIQLFTATHYTGTIPFMARDLLVDGGPPPHLYRYDLESFFYILVWAALHYDFSRQKRHPLLPVIQKWDGLTMDDVFQSKTCFIIVDLTRNQVLHSVRPECRALPPWLTSLGSLFQLGQGIMSNNHLSGWDNDLHGGYITFENFMTALGRTPHDTYSYTQQLPHAS